jgi:predicted methyltransferase
MKFTASISAAALMAASLLIHSAAQAVTPAFITAAVADMARPAEDKQRDADRKPAATLQFAGIRPGAHVVELLPGGGYYTRLLSRVVGPHGKLYAVAPAPREGTPANAPDRTAPIRALAQNAHYGNITVLVQPIRQLTLPAKADVVWTSLNYHDMHNVPGIDLLAFNKSIYEALKPGGLYFVVDHAAAAGAPANVTSTLHRIDPVIVKREIRAAGFVLEAEGDALMNPADPRTAAVFDPAIRGKTAQFMLKFRKPR